MKKVLIGMMVLFVLYGCSKNDSASGTNASDITNRLNFIVEDNKSNFSSFSAGLSRTEYKYTLSDVGPYTVLLPDNNAFISAGYANANAVLTESASLLNALIPYHITYGKWELNKLPFKFNQEIESITGAKMYVTRWVKNKDTIVTINGTKVISYNLNASNGLIQVLNAVLVPLVHSTLSDAIAADSSLTYFNVAIQRAGIKDQLASKEKTFTLFAPNNNAFIAAGYTSIQSLYAEDPQVLARLLQYSMFEGRKFIYDFVLTTDATDHSQQKMQTGNNINITLIKSGVNYTGISIKGIGNKNDGTIKKSNVLAGNGVLHITDIVLKETL